MKVLRSISPYIVFAEDTVLSALTKITANQTRMIFVVSEAGILQGAMSDGDFRRWIAACPDIDLNSPVTAAMNPHCVSAAEDASVAKLSAAMNERIGALPLLDRHGRIVAVALPGSRELSFGDRLIGENQPCFLIAEIGNNHNGSLEYAFQLIDAAASAGADCAKFQMRNMESLYINAGNSNDMASDLGTQYTLDLLERFQLSNDDLFRCFDHAIERNLVPLCTPWDEPSLAKLEQWGMPGYKVASADFTNHGFLSALAATNKPLIASTGMATEHEIRAGIRHLKELDVDYVLLHCNSTYPTPFKDVNLRYLERLKQLAESPVGYSGHERGTEVAVAAVAMGAVVVEKHITLDRGMEGNDHKVSLLPQEFDQMVNGIRRVEESLGTKDERIISQGELMNREVLAKSLVSNCAIPVGTPILESMVRVQCPGQGLQPYRLTDLIGRCLAIPKKEGEPFFQSDLDQPTALPRKYQFMQPFGAPVRYHDINHFTSVSNLDLVEIHLSYKDLDVDLDVVIPQNQSLGLVVHAPELFAGDHTLDLCSLDSDYRSHSIKELQRVINIAARLRDRFQCNEPVLLVTNVGGFSEQRHLNAAEHTPMCERLINSLDCLDGRNDVEVIPQTMPPYPWHFGGQRFHNLFVDSNFIENFCVEHSYRVCLDVSHSKLACNHLHHSFREFLVHILPHTAHLHLADARGVDGEGLQIGEGDIEWVMLFELLAELAPSASFIPEIWQGHKNGGEGAWLALQRLESYAHQAITGSVPSTILSTF